MITITGGSIGSVNMNIGNNVFTMSGGTVVGDVIGFGNNATRLTMDANLVLGDGTTLTGALTIDSSSTLFAGGGNYAVVANDGVSPVTLTNAGIIDLTNGASGATDRFSVFGNYVGTGGTLRLQTVLGADGSPSDRLVISGAGNSASGSTGVAIVNAGGSGAATASDGILVVQAVNGASTAAGSFSLQGIAAAGAYEYLLFQGGLAGSNPNNWYLRSVIVASPGQQAPPSPLPSTPGLIPIIRPEVAVHSIVPAMARSLDLLTLGTFHQRQGGQSLLRSDPSNAAWGRVFGQHTREDFSGGVVPSFDGVLGGLQAGTDLGRFDWAGGHRSRFGLYVSQTEMSGDVRGAVLAMIDTDAGDIALGATTVGAYWTHIGPANWYIDAVVQGSFVSGDAKSNRGVTGHVRGNGFAASLEGGYPVRLTPWLSFEPQAQAIWQHMSLDSSDDGMSAIVYKNADVFVGRIGARLHGQCKTLPQSGSLT